MDGQPAKRLDYIDNLRSAMIVLVVGVHVACTYSQMGFWYYVERKPIDMATTLFFSTYLCFLQAFFMGFLFLLAGYFTPGAYDRKGFVRFAGDRFVRLGIPSILFAFTLHPLTAYWGSDWHTKSGPTDAYKYYLTHGIWLDGSGPMWFAVALLLFSMVYGAFRLAVAKPRSLSAGKVSLALVAGFGLLIAAAAYCIRLFWPIGTHFHTYQFCFFAQYVVLFLAGIAAYRRKSFDGLSKRLGYGLLGFGLVLGIPGFLALLAAGGAFQHGFAAFTGHGTWQSGAYAVWESLVCVAMCAGMLVWFRERVSAKGRFAKLLADNSFGIYVVHPPVLVAITLALAPVALAPIVKWAIVWPLAVIATLAVSAALRCVPGVRRIL